MRKLEKPTGQALAAGIDTWSVCWYVRDDGPACRAMEALATEPAPRGKLFRDRVAGHRIGWFPEHRMVFAEGHPVREQEGGLARADALPGVVTALVECMADLGVDLPMNRPGPRLQPDGESRAFIGIGFEGIRRLDSTVDLGFDHPAEGLAALAGVAALPLPRMKTQVMREVGGRRVETVYFRGTSGKRVVGRWYDKGIEAGMAKRGLMIRPEDQRRFAKDARLDVESVAQSSYVRDAFVRRFEPLWRASKGIKVAGAVELAQRIADLVDEGRLTPGEGKALAGYLVLESGQANRQSRAQQYRDRARCRDHGLVLADGVFDDVEVDLGEVLERALDSEAWGCEG